MTYIHKFSSVFGKISNPFPEDMVCVWNGDHIFHYNFAVTLSQLIFFISASRFIYFLIKPLHQSLFSAQIIAGIIIGHFFLGPNRTIFLEKLFPPSSILIVRTAAAFGYMIHLFVLAVQIDARMLKRPTKSVILIGVLGMLVPPALCRLINFFATRNAQKQVANTSTNLTFLCAFSSISFFPVVTSLLSDLKILNSELGRLASSVALFNDIFAWIAGVIFDSVTHNKQSEKWIEIAPILSSPVLWFVLLGITIFFVFRPLILWIARKTLQGEPMEEFHFLAITVIVLGCGVFSEVVGQRGGVACFLLGLVLPDGPPLGETLVHKLDTLAGGLFVPAFVVITGLQTDLFTLHGKSTAVMEFFILVGYIGKFTGCVLAALFCRVPFWDAVCLGFIMCTKGVLEIYVFNLLKDNKFLAVDAFTLLVITMLFMTGISRCIIGFLYNPSKRYIAYVRRSIQHSRQSHLGILVCFHTDNHVPAIVNLLEASNPTIQEPISVFVLQLLELKGRATAMFFLRRKMNTITSAFDEGPSMQKGSKPIINAFDKYEQRHEAAVTVEVFTAIAPYASMYNDICSLALDKKIDIVIVPFHKQWAIDGSLDDFSYPIATVNQHVMHKAPCTVGILVDRSSNRSILTGGQGQESLYRIALLYLGGDDDREALAYSLRMAGNENLSLIVVRLKPETHYNEREWNQDTEFINYLRHNAKEEICYKEETVKNGEETIQVVLSVKDAVDLVIVGKHHQHNSEITRGITEWGSECPELGVIGDMLASSDFQFSLLVVQQQPAS